MSSSPRNNSKRASKGSQGLPPDTVKAASQGADDRKPPPSSFSLTKLKEWWKEHTGDCSDSRQSSPKNEIPDESKTVKVTSSQDADGETTLKPKVLGTLIEEESPSGKISESERASEGTQGWPSDDKNLEPEADRVKEVSQGGGITRTSSTGFFPKFENPFKKKSTRNEATSNSQQSPLENENPNESKTGIVTTSQGADGRKTTFKPKGLSIGLEEESQSWIISEGDSSAELLEACWLDVTGSMTATKGNKYEISFKLSMNEENAFGWKDPVYVMAKIGEEGQYECVKVDLSLLGKDEKVFPLEKFEIKFKSDDKTASTETKLYFGLYEVWTNEWKGGLRIHEAIVQEGPAEGSASTSNTGPEASNSTSRSNNDLDGFASASQSHEEQLEEKYWDKNDKQKLQKDTGKGKERKLKAKNRNSHNLDV
ncbi:unnamed protein product [Dovyalis caffra]|uniref:Uncharacterized protein n=1 Tax=Dovyalis caffra TaxID=77055 RepID=A0AAV1RK04_9ROSI|nr:unnamed protein product [Dovyalis caffra]